MKDLQSGQAGMLVGHTVQHGGHTHQSMRMPQLQGPLGFLFFMVLKGQPTIPYQVIPQSGLLNEVVCFTKPRIQRAGGDHTLKSHTENRQYQIAGSRKDQKTRRQGTQ
jgi:hypothetical protein